MSRNITAYTNTPPTFTYAVTSTSENAKSSLDQLSHHILINDILQQHM